MNAATTPTIAVEVLEQVQPNGTLVDVREAREYAAALRACAFEAYSVAGGTKAWQRSGHPVEGGL